MEWISVEVRLPRDTRQVFIKPKGYPRGIVGFYSPDKAKWNISEKGWEYLPIEKTTHWARLPEPPE